MLTKGWEEFVVAAIAIAIIVCGEFSLGSQQLGQYTDVQDRDRAFTVDSSPDKMKPLPEQYLGHYSTHLLISSSQRLMFKSHGHHIDATSPRP